MYEKLVCFAAGGLLLAAQLGCQSGDVISGCGGAARPEYTSLSAQGSPAQFLVRQQGKLVVALMGMEGCPGTAEATKVLADISREYPEDVVCARIDVPPPGESLEPVKEWSYSYYYALDADRRAARQMEFFYYPTLYLIDGDGDMRFAGGYDQDKLSKMISEILVEKPGAKKKIYTTAALAVGAPGITIVGKDPNGKDVQVPTISTASKKKAMLLCFTAIECPFSARAMQELPRLAGEFAPKGVSFVVVEKGTDAAAIKSFYDQVAFKGPVIVDTDGSISRDYGVEPIPFYFVVSADGKIAKREPYTPAGARLALEIALGIKPDTPSKPSSTGAG